MSERITIEEPRDIDTEPELVGGIAVEQIHGLLLKAAELMEPTAVMARSSYQSELLSDDPELPASELAATWEESNLNARLTRLDGGLQTLISLCESARSELP